MNERSPLLELSCPCCQWSQPCGFEAMIGWLRDIGGLRRESHPDPELVEELFERSSDRFTCPECESVGLRAAPSTFDDAEWSAIPPCEICGVPIPPERLEIFPQTTMCAPCQQKADRGETFEEPNYCPHCGSIMAMSQSRTGIARYEMKCPDCRK